MPTHRTAELRMLQAEHRVGRWELERTTDKRDFMDHVKRTIVDRMLWEIRKQLEQAITIEHGIDHAADMETWRGRVLVGIQSTQAPAASEAIRYMDDSGLTMVRTRAPDLKAAPKPEPKFDPKDLDAVLPSDVGTW